MSDALPELPAGWEWCELQDVAEVRLGRQRSPKNHQGDNMVPYVRAANVTWDGFDLSDVKEMNFTPDEVEKYALRDGDILLSEASGSASEVGKPAIWRSQLETSCFQNTLIRVRSDGPKPDYLLLVLREAARSGAFVGAAVGVGIHHLGASRLARWPIPLPPLDEQERICATVDRFANDLRSATAEIAAARSLTRAYLLARLRAIDAFDAEPLGEIADIRSGLTKGRRVVEPASEVPYLRAGNLGNGELDLADIKTIPATDAEVERFRLLPGDVLLVEGSGTAARLGQGWMWEGQLDVCLHQNHVFRARLTPDRAVPRYVAWALQAPGVRRHLLGLAKTTSGLNTISRKQVSAVPIPLPDLVVQEKLVTELDAAARMVVELERQIDAALVEGEALERALLAAAVTGALVRQEPTDVPAVELLESVQRERSQAERRRTRSNKGHEAPAVTYS